MTVPFLRTCFLRHTEDVEARVISCIIPGDNYFFSVGKTGFSKDCVHHTVAIYDNVCTVNIFLSVFSSFLPF